jgi:hypothetical protein
MKKLKYLFNIIVAFAIVYFVTGYFYLIALFPRCDMALSVIFDLLKYQTLFFTFVAATFTTINVLIERKIGKSKALQRSLNILIFHTLLFITVFVINSIIIYYKFCPK